MGKIDPLKIACNNVGKQYYYQITYNLTIDHEATIELPIKGLTQREEIVAYVNKLNIIKPWQEVIRVEEVEPNKCGYTKGEAKKPVIIKTL